MDDCGGSRCEGLIPTVKKKRSQRRRRIVSSTFPEFLHHSPLTSLSDNVGRFSSDKYADDANAGGRSHNLNYSISRDYSSIKKKEDGGSTATYSNARGGDDTNPRHGTSLRQSGNAGEGVANDSKMKLKVGEVRGAIQTKKSSYGSSSLFSSESVRPSDASEPRQNLTPQDNSSVHGPPTNEKSVSNRISCEDFRGGTFGASKSDLEKVPRRNVFEKQGDKPHQNRKSQRVPRRLVLDELDEDEYVDDANVGGRIYNLNNSISRDSSANRFKGDYSSIKKKEDGGSTVTYSNARGGDDMNPGHGTSLRQSGNAGEGVANDSKMKLKVGEVRRAIQIKNNSYGSSSSLVSSKSARPSDASEPRQNLAPQKIMVGLEGRPQEFVAADNSSVHGPPADKKSGSNKISCEDFLGGTFGSSKSDLEKVPRRNVFEKQGDKPHQNRKSERVLKEAILDELDEDEYAMMLMLEGESTTSITLI
ncbi:hypothetical protein HAX54_022535 [Datura stramonium]|uniref:Uncharacterized protein n=1 Tax=Datura stramonium TaxID=4076 RepID=A0ABS8UWY5_DATST|nr:hypothetical protein [Datura stramonium]